jgi:putative tryptophan/tyrosine transport system substrate-binding protein
MRRREFIKVIAGSGVTWPLAARAQQGERARRIGVLLNRAAGDPEVADSIGAFVQGMGELGWRIGGNLRIEYRYSAGNPELFRKYASELVALAPDAILAASTLSVAALQQFSRSIPIVFTSVADPVGAGLVDSLARPGGNATGFMLAEFSVSGKLLELLKQVAPELKRVAVFRHSANPSGIAQFGAIQAAAVSLGVAVSPIDVQDASEIERAVAAFVRSANGGMIVTGSASATIHRELIIALAARYKVPAVYANRFAVASGGLISYGPSYVDQFRRAASYVDRILKGEKPADLPVQAPTKYELVINLKTARTLGLGVPQTLLASANEVIE